MKPTQLLWHGATWLAVSGTCLPSTMVLANDVRSAPAAATAAAQSTAPIHDVALQPGGMLVGQILDQTMQPMRGTAIAVQVNGRTAATTTSDDHGVFAVNGLRGGIHQLVVGESTENCRLWSSGTAPPHAVSHLRFVPGQSDVVRGQWGPPPSYNSMLGWATNPWVIGGVVATAIAVPVVLNNIDDDDEDEGS